MSSSITRNSEDRLEELKRLESLLEIAINQQEERIDQAKRGKLTFTQITNKTLFGLLRGDLRRLREEKEQTILDIAELERKITESKQEPEPVNLFFEEDIADDNHSDEHKSLLDHLNALEQITEQAEFDQSSDTQQASMGEEQRDESYPQMSERSPEATSSATDTDTTPSEPHVG